MANNNGAIINSWSLATFRDNHGKMKLAPLVNNTTGETYTAAAFVRDDTTTFVGISEKLPELTPAYIKQNYQELQVVELQPDADVLKRRKEEGRQLESYVLCKKGNDSWEDCDF